MTPTGLGDIIVTANRRAENLQRAPIAISAVSADALRQEGVSRPQELTALVPALQVATAAGPYTAFYLRGVGTLNGNALTDSPVAFNYNGVYIGRPSGTTGFFYDLDRVEVLKGPQGTLYGRNATGGAINVITKTPDLHNFGGYIDGEYGNYHAVRLEGAINAPVGDNAALRLAGIFVRHDGYMQDGTDDQKDYGGRLSFRWDPTSNLKINLYADYLKQGAEGAGATPLAPGLKDRPGILSPEGQAFFTSQPVPIAGRNFAAIPTRPFQDNKFFGTHATVDYTTPIGTITVIPAYRGGRLDFGTSAPGFQIVERERDDQYSVETRLASDNNRPLRYLLGFFYYNETDNVPAYAVDSEYNASYQNYRSHDDSKAVFGRLTYALIDTFRATVGARYTDENKTFKGNYLGLSRLCINFPAFQTGAVQLTAPCPGAAQFPFTSTQPVAATTPFNPAFPYTGLNEIYGPTAIFQTASPITSDRDESFHRFTWRAGLDWDITPRNLLYGSYETGFKSGGFFFSADAGIFRPERIKAFTLGSKNRFLDNRLQLNLELFHWRYSDQQISHVSQDSAGNVIFATENVGVATFKGFELESRYLLTRNTELSTDVQYLDGKYNSFTYTVPNQGPPFTGCNVLGVANAFLTLNCSGRRPPNAPKWILNLGAQQTIPLETVGKLVLNARTHYQSRTLTGLEFLPAEYQRSYWFLDGSVTYSSPSDRFFISAFVNNATDRTVIANSTPQPLGAFAVASLRPPRTYGVRAGYKF